MALPFGRRAAVAHTVMAVILALLVTVISPVAGPAQSCVNCVLYARTELNLRKGPSINDAILTFVPRGAAVHRNTGPETNSYAPVTYNGITGWVVALGLVASLTELDPVAGTTPVPVTPAPVATAAPVTVTNDRVTLTELTLRSGPAADATAILGIPQGSIVTLTREGAENGYVTVDYGGVRGWVYADLIGPV